MLSTHLCPNFPKCPLHSSSALANLCAILTVFSVIVIDLWHFIAGQSFKEILRWTIIAANYARSPRHDLEPNIFLSGPTKLSNWPFFHTTVVVSPSSHSCAPCISRNRTQGGAAFTGPARDFAQNHRTGIFQKWLSVKSRTWLYVSYNRK